MFGTRLFLRRLAGSLLRPASTTGVNDDGAGGFEENSVSPFSLVIVRAQFFKGIIGGIVAGFAKPFEFVNAPFQLIASSSQLGKLHHLVENHIKQESIG
jgi:hypothetical protein